MTKAWYTDTMSAHDIDGFGRTELPDGEGHTITLGIPVVLPDGTKTTGSWYTRQAQLRLPDGRIAEDVKFSGNIFDDTITVVRYGRVSA